MSRHSISFIGLDFAGKTTVATYLSTGRIIRDFRPTLDINYTEVIFDQIDYMFLDYPGQAKLRHSWNKCLAVSRFLVYVLDISTPGRFLEAEDVLTKVLKRKDMDHIPLIFLYHKTDLDKSGNKLKYAKLFFDREFIEQFGERDVRFFDTTIEKPKTLDVVKNYMVDHIVELAKAHSYLDL